MLQYRSIVGYWLLVAMDILYESFVSTEKCVEVTGLSKYEVSVLVAKRAKELVSGAVPVVPRDNKKHIGLALEEIVSGELNLSELSERFVTSLENTAKERASKERGRNRDFDTFRKNMLDAASSDDDKLSADKLMSAFDQDFDGAVKSGESLDVDDVGVISYSGEEIEEVDNDQGSV